MDRRETEVLMTDPTISTFSAPWPRVSSFPFFELARRDRVDYGMVLRSCGWWEAKGSGGDEWFKLPHEVRCALAAAIDAERARRRAVNADRK